jgi:hypothetical protein
LSARRVQDLLRSVDAHGRSLGGELSAMLDELMWQGILTIVSRYLHLFIV